MSWICAATYTYRMQTYVNQDSMFEPVAVCLAMKYLNRWGLSCSSSSLYHDEILIFEPCSAWCVWLYSQDLCWVF